MKKSSAQSGLESLKALWHYRWKNPAFKKKAKGKYSWFWANNREEGWARTAGLTTRHGLVGQKAGHWPVINRQLQPTIQKWTNQKLLIKNGTFSLNNLWYGFSFFFFLKGKGCLHCPEHCIFLSALWVLMRQHQSPCLTGISSLMSRSCWPWKNIQSGDSQCCLLLS